MDEVDRIIIRSLKEIGWYVFETVCCREGKGLHLQTSGVCSRGVSAARRLIFFVYLFTRLISLIEPLLAPVDHSCMIALD